MRKLASRFVKLGMALGLASFFNTSAQSQINVDGMRDAGYDARASVQTIASSWGPGNTLASLSFKQAGATLNVFLAGRANGNAVVLFIDSKDGGANTIVNNLCSTPGSDEGWRLNNFGTSATAGMTFESNFSPDFCIFVGSDGHSHLFPLNPASPQPRQYLGNYTNTSGASGGPLSLLKADPSADVSNASTHDKGYEFALGLSGLGIASGATNHPIKFLALIINNGVNQAPNQVLGPLPNSSDLGGWGGFNAVNFETLSGIQTVSVNVDNADFDGDEIPDATDTDDDNDGLLDTVETNTGTFVDANNTGSNPLNADTDQDAVNDGTEVSSGRNPLIFDYASMAVPGNYAFIGEWFPDGTYGTGMTQNPPYLWKSRANLPAAVDILFKFAANGAWDVQWGKDPDRVGYAKRGGDAFNPKVQATGYHQFTFNQVTLEYSLVRMGTVDFENYANFEAIYNLVLGETGDDDEDGVSNGQEYVLSSDPLKNDTDMDGILDGTESAGSVISTGNGDTLTIITSAILSDTDGDGMDDRWELLNGLDPTDNGTNVGYRNLTQLTGVTSNPNGSMGDPDGDNLTNLQEYQANPKGNPLAASGAFAKTSNTIHLTGAFTVPSWTNDPETIGVDLDLVGNFLWKVMLRISSVPTDKNFKFVSDKSWTTSWGKITSTAVGKAIKQDGSSPLVANEISAAGYYLFTLNESTGDYSVIPVLLTDSDGDEIADEWETFYGAMLSPAQTNLSPSDDPDSDGQTNLQEYLAGSHPLKDTVAPAVSLTSSLDKISVVSVGASAPALSASDVSATDNVTPSASIQVTFQPSSLDTATAGVRKITYTATDAAGNRATLSRVFLVGDLVGSGAYYNLQGPSTPRLNRMGTLSIFGQIYIDGATQGAGAAPAVSMWVGVSSSNTDPATWSSDAWRPANLNAAVTGNNDEYSASINGADYPSGTYYYATRWQVTSGGYGYGGTTGPWNGTTSMSGVLTVEGARTLTFTVNMNGQINKLLFNPTTQGVEVRGDFNTWAGGAATLSDDNSDGIYTGSFTVAGDLGGLVEYKFYRTGASGADYEGLADNRTIILGADGVNSTLPTAYFNNDDGIGPVISIIGDNPLNLNVGGTYTDPGATANDAIEGSRSVTLSGTVDTALAGTYTVTYNASDANDNAGTAVTRRVVVSAVGSTFAGAYPGASMTGVAPNGLTYLANYAFGGNETTPATLPVQDTSDPTKLRLVVVFRTDDSTLPLNALGGETTADLAGGWSASGVSVEDSTDVSPVPPNTVRKVISVDRGDDPKKFLRATVTK